VYAASYSNVALAPLSEEQASTRLLRLSDDSSVQHVGLLSARGRLLMADSTQKHAPVLLSRHGRP
jgi:hypothetical protein